MATYMRLTGGARRAERVSRRDLANELLLIEATARHDDVATTLTHFDRALLVYPDANQQLFPVLSRALSDPQIRAALAKDPNSVRAV